MNLVIYNMSRHEDWDRGIANRNFFVLRELASSGRFDHVLSVDVIPHGAAKAARRAVGLRGRPRMRSQGAIDVLSAYTPSQAARMREDWLDSHGREHILWCCDPFRAEELTASDSVLTVFDAVDDWRGNPSLSKYQGWLTRQYAIVQERADIIFAVSASSAASCFPGRKDVRVIGNGVDLVHFATDHAGSRNAFHEKLKDIPAPIFGYMGVLSGKKIDMQSLEALAEACHESERGSVVLSGPVWKDFDRMRLERHGNVHFVGVVPYEERPVLYAAFDICLLPHAANAFTGSMDPMKLYEYLAAGRPVVSTRVAGADQFGDLVMQTDDPVDFAKKALAVAADPADDADARREAVRQFDWSRRVRSMLVVLDGELGRVLEEKESR